MYSVLLSTFSINLLAFYHECRSLIGRGGSRGRMQGCAPPPPRDDLWLCNATGILQKKKTMWFIGVEVVVHPLLKEILDPPLIGYATLLTIHSLIDSSEYCSSVPMFTK